MCTKLVLCVGWFACFPGFLAARGEREQPTPTIVSMRICFLTTDDDKDKDEEVM